MRALLLVAIAAPWLAVACSPIPRPGSWRIEGNVPSSLVYVAHMVRLPDGRVLFVGLDSTMVIFDPAHNRWMLGARAPALPAGGTVTELADGSLLIAGGESFGTSGAETSRTAYLYLPDQDRWERVGDMLQGRAYFSATRLLDGRVLVVGGEAAGQSLATCEFYDPRTRSWTEAPSLPVRRIYQSSVLLTNGAVLVAGGDVDAGFNNGPVAPAQSPGSFPYNTEEIFDPQQKRWSTLTPPQPVEDPTVTALPDGDLLFTGGHFGNQASPFTYVYSPTMRSWTRKADWKSGGNPTVLNDGRLLFLFPPYTYDLSGDLWMPATAPPAGYSFLGPSVTITDRLVLAVASPGRFGQGGLVVALFDPAGLPPLPGSAGALAEPSIAGGLAIVVLALLLLTGLRYAIRIQRAHT